MQQVYFLKKIMLVLVFLAYISSFQGSDMVFGQENDSVYDRYQEGTTNNEQTESPQNQGTVENRSLASEFIKFVFSFGLIIILLLYVLKFLKSKSKRVQSQGPFHSMGGYPLGTNRSLQMLMVGKTLYILGIGNEVQLIRAIEPGEEQDLILQSLVDETERNQKVNFLPFKKKKTDNWEQIFMNQIDQVKNSSFSINKQDD